MLDAHVPLTRNQQTHPRGSSLSRHCLVDCAANIRSAVGNAEVTGRGFQPRQVELPGLVAPARRALRPGGMVVVEAFHRDATKTRPIGGAVVFDSNELLKLFGDFRVIRYEDTAAIGDFGLSDTRVVRLAAVKQ